MKTRTLKVTIHTDDDPAYCSPTCPFLFYFRAGTIVKATCTGFNGVELRTGYRSGKPLRCEACLDNCIQDEGT